MRRRAVIDLNSPRPVWRIPAWSVHAVRDAFGAEWTVSRVGATASSDGDGGGGSPEAVRRASRAEIYIGWGVPAGVAAAARGSLRWAHTAAAGVGASVTPALRATRAVLTNSRGIQAEPMADWALAAIGFCLRGFHLAVDAQRRREWAKDAFTDGRLRILEFGGARIGVVGLGGVGRALAARCAALGMTVRGVRRHPSRRRVRGVQWIGGPEDLRALAGESDVLVVCTPHTRETHGMIGAAVLRALPKGAYVINLARGPVLDERAVEAALDAGRVAGCVLDVFDREPLPARHPWWRHPGVLVFPHSSAVSSRFWERQTALLLDNIARYRSGRRLRNRVNLDLGY